MVKKIIIYFIKIQGVAPRLRIFITKAMLISTTSVFFFFYFTIGLDSMIFKRQIEKVLVLGFPDY